MWRLLLLFALVGLASSCCPKHTPLKQQQITRAIAYFNTSPVSGSITFSSVAGGTKVEGTINGLTNGKHGFHIHQLGDLTSCLASGGHYNPLNKKHGAYNAVERHVGDLQQLNSENQIATISYVDTVIPLIGEHSIVGRSLVIHSGEDDLGLKGDAGSISTGNAGSRVACAVIGILAP